MFLTNHVLTGIVLGHTIENDFILAPVAFSSHFFMDALPHFGHHKDPDEKHDFEEDLAKGLHKIRDKGVIVTGVIDFTLATSVLVASCLIWPERALNLVIGGFFAALPDLFYIPEGLFGWRLDGKLRWIHWKIQWYERPPGIFTEGLWAAIMLYLLRQKL